MKRILDQPPRGGLILYRILVAIVLALVLLILGGTLYALFRRPAPKEAAPAALPVDGTAGRIFTGLGRMRAQSGGSPPATVILSPAFPYNPGDRPFAEELALRVGDLRRITVDYFAARGPEELRELEEGIIKGELLDRYNRVLRLGKIETLYFDDFMIID